MQEFQKGRNDIDMKKRICVVTGSRAEYGLLEPLLKLLKSDSNFILQVVATGMHLSPIFGSTYKEIEAAGFTLRAKVNILSRSDSSVGVAKSIGTGVARFADVFERLCPDMVVLLGDRFEIFSAAVAAYICNIPISHLYGGESTEGAFDEALRHSITKMSFLHFVSHEAYRRKIIQLGEDPRRVFVTGALGVENIKSIRPWDKKRLEDDLGIVLDRQFVLVTFHPVTLETQTAGIQMKQLLAALDAFRNIKKIFTMPNADTGGTEISRMISAYVKKRKDEAFAFTSLGTVRYLSLVSRAKAVIGNSSSGIIEVPSFKIPTVNIGDRQKGRLRAKSVIDCPAEKTAIITAIRKVFSPSFQARCKKITNPYDRGYAAQKILRVISAVNWDKLDLKKSFFDVRGINV